MEYSHRPLASFVLPLCLAGLLVMLGSSCQNGQVSPDGIRRSEITELPANAAYSLVIDTFGTMPMDEFWIFYPAAEGGEYVFLFYPTNEVAPLTFLTSSNELLLVAVVKLDKREDFPNSNGTYVFPKAVEGKRFTGIDLENKTLFEELKARNRGIEVLVIPNIIDKKDLPIISVYVSPTPNKVVTPENMFSGPDISPRVIISVWNDGTVIYSPHRIEGGRPYYKGHIEPSQLTSFLKKLDQTDFWDTGVRSVWVGLDSDWSTIVITDTHQKKDLISWHELREQNAKTVVTDKGVEVLGGRNRADVMPNCSEEYLKFLEQWNFIRNELDSMLGGIEGEPVGDILFEWNYVNHKIWKQGQAGRQTKNEEPHLRRRKMER